MKGESHEDICSRQNKNKCKGPEAGQLVWSGIAKKSMWWNEGKKGEEWEEILSEMGVESGFYWEVGMGWRSDKDTGFHSKMGRAWRILSIGMIGFPCNWKRHEKRLYVKLLALCLINVTTLLLSALEAVLQGRDTAVLGFWWISLLTSSLGVWDMLTNVQPTHLPTASILLGSFIHSLISPLLLSVLQQCLCSLGVLFSSILLHSPAFTLRKRDSERDFNSRQHESGTGKEAPKGSVCSSQMERGRLSPQWGDGLCLFCPGLLTHGEEGGWLLAPQPSAGTYRRA